MLADIAAAMRVPREARDAATAVALAQHVGEPELLTGLPCPAGRDHYARHLLFAAPDYAILAIVWRPGQMSPVHGHRTWCAFGIHRGVLAETLFTVENGRPIPFSCVQRRPGDVNHAPADPRAIHRLANLGTEDAISIHVYGAAFDSIGQAVNQVWAD
ncbi:MAG TPA: cysteine dioxygenase family protein [Acetobacteraceae bacterium]|jgi:predicted metal-dependent enzyme (double-stranded beta helix superfamily)|nr:cysteine dioxygenase family protein [Acetobacteraceae bacterium]